MNDKKIAKIYYDVQVFLTKAGDLYGYVIQANGKPRCRKLTSQEKIAFWEGKLHRKKINSVSWQPVAIKVFVPVKLGIERLNEVPR